MRLLKPMVRIGTIRVWDHVEMSSKLLYDKAVSVMNVRRDGG